MSKTINPHVEKWRMSHHAALADLFGHDQDAGLDLWRKLSRIERAANQSACDYCNGVIDSDAWDKLKDKYTAQVAKLSFDGKVPAGFFVNGDPRGYTLKIESEQAKLYVGLQKDWGGYGCLAARID